MEHYRKALAIQEKALGPTHPTVGNTYGNLCLVNWRQGKREEAVAMHRKLAASQLSVQRYASMLAYDAGVPTETRPLALSDSRLRRAWCRFQRDLCGGDRRGKVERLAPCFRQWTPCHLPSDAPHERCRDRLRLSLKGSPSSAPAQTPCIQTQPPRSPAYEYLLRGKLM